MATRIAIVLMVSSYANVWTILGILYSLPVPLNPLVFFLSAVFIVGRGNQVNPLAKYLILTWLCFGVFEALGFLNIGNVPTYTLVQHGVKLWIPMIGFPWLMGPVLQERHRTQIETGILWLAVAGGLVCGLEFFSEEARTYFFDRDLYVGRAAGFWINANNASAMLVAGLALNLPRILDGRMIHLVAGLVVAGGALLTFSRTGAAVLLATNLVYAFTSRTRRSFIWAGAFIAASVWITISTYDTMDSASQERVDSVVGMAGGEDVENNRTEVWEIAWDLIQQSPWVGYGNGGADEIIPITDEGIGPHNTFLYAALNSGLFGFCAFSAWLIALVVLGFQPARLIDRGITLALTLVWVAFSITSHDIFRNQSVAPILVLFLLRARNDSPNEAVA